MAQANGCGGAAVSQHLIWPVCEAHQACLSVCKLACEFNISVMHLVAFSWCWQSWHTCLLWPVHPRAISNIKGIYVPYDVIVGIVLHFISWAAALIQALLCVLYHGRPFWYTHAMGYNHDYVTAWVIITFSVSLCVRVRVHDTMSIVYSQNLVSISSIPTL